MNLDISARPGALGRQFIDIHGESCDAILQILDAGWRRALASSNARPGGGEVEITECLRTGMREALAERIEEWCKKMTVLPGTESRSNPNVLTPDGRTDIPIYFQDIRERYNEHDPHAIIECKRVAGNRADLCRLYVVDGIDDRFKTGKYASNHAVAFMVGYLLSGDAKAAVRGINKYLTGKGRQSEHLGSSGILKVSWARSSRHPRPNRPTPIDLHHAFFGFQPTSP